MLDLRLVVTDHVFGDSPIKVPCVNPAHDDPQPSMGVYSDHLHCWGCGFHRNDWDEALGLLLGITAVEAREVADKYEGNKHFPQAAATRGTESLPSLPLGRADLYHRFMRSRYPEREQWFLERGITSETVEAERLGYDGFRYTIPIYDGDGNLVTIRYRADYTRLPDKVLDGLREVPVPKYSGIRGRNQMFLYGAHWLRPDRKYTIICEGELDALLLHQLGYAACSATNGAGQARRVLGLLSDNAALSPGHCIYIATDQDRGDGRKTRKGEEAAVEVAMAASEMGMVVYRLSWLLGKDITEHYTRNGNELDFIKGEWDGKRFRF